MMRAAPVRASARPTGVRKGDFTTRCSAGGADLRNSTRRSPYPPWTRWPVPRSSAISAVDALARAAQQRHGHVIGPGGGAAGHAVAEDQHRGALFGAQAEARQQTEVAVEILQHPDVPGGA